ncbi:MAG: HAMP domain-containing protein [Alphaproteobacteria bacterium]|nr:HAMP domain-containing protein [Alphaproteobacteria bacterium]
MADYKNIILRIVPQKLWMRALLILLMTMLLVQGASLIVFHDRHWRFVNYKLADNLASEVAFLYNEMEHNENYFARYNRDRSNVLDVKLAVGSAEKFKSLSPLPRNKQRLRLERSLRTYLKQPYRLARYGDGEVAIGVASLERGDFYYFIIPERRVFDNTINIFLYWVISSGIILSLVAGFFLYRQMRPMSKLAALADNFGKGRDLDSLHAPRDIPLYGAQEIRMVARSFNQMMRRIYYQLKQRTTMLAGVSHDLRTPLTKLRLNLALMPEHKQNKDIIEKLKANIADMEKMIELYLQFARGEGNEALRNVKVALFIDTLMNHWHAVAKNNEKKISCQLNIKKQTTMLIRVVAMNRCLNNIIANAFKNASKIMLAVDMFADIKNNENFIVFHVGDNGPGVPEEEQEKIFEAFY